MSIKTDLKNEKKYISEVKDFFDRVISVEEFARIIREYNFVIANEILSKEEPYIHSSISQGRYYLNELAEMLDPYFDRKK